MRTTGRRIFNFYWITILLFGVIVTPGVRAQPTSLTEQEKRWLEAHPRIRVGYDPKWAPFSFRDTDGQFAGIDADMLALLEQKLGIKFQVIATESWDETYRCARAGEIDFMVGTAITTDRQQWLRFTQSYQTIPIGIVARADQSFMWSVTEMDGKTIALPQGYAITEMIPRKYPGMKIRFTPDITTAFELTSHGDADAVITNLVNASYVIKTRGLTNLKIVGIFPETFSLRYAVRQDWPELVQILDKGIASISSAEVQALNHQWVRLDYSAVVRWDLVWKIGAGVLVILAVVIGTQLWRARTVAAELKKRRAIQEELEKTNAQLAARHREISDLMSVAAHDLRNPLAAVMLSGDLLTRNDSAQVREIGGSVQALAEQMHQLVTNLLDVHALEEGGRQMRLVEIDGLAVLREALKSFHATAQRKEIVIEEDELQGKVLLVNADVGALRQVFENLISNALKFSPSGKSIRLNAGVREDGFVQFSVSDQGPGVQPDERERIFSKYVRGRANPTAGEKSTGLGLAIVREAIVAMRGRAWCEGSACGGACFVVILPKAR